EAATLAAVTAPTGGEFTLTEDAVARLNRVPAGFMRDMTREEVEKVARERRVGVIDPALCQAGVGPPRVPTDERVGGCGRGEKQARQLRAHGVQGASRSLDSTDPARHDRFRHLPGAWQGAVRATEALRAEGLDFSVHMSVTDCNADEIPAMIDLARELGARV